MKPSKLKTLLLKTIPAQLPVLIKGAPGVGKTDIVTQASEEVDANLLVSHPVVSDPIDYKGLAAVVEGEAEFLPFGDLRQLIETDVLTVAFLDDLGQAPATVQAAAMQLILGRKINGHRISEKVVFVAATNRREDRAGVTGILEPVKSRFATIVEVKPDVDDWTKWAVDNNVPSEVVAFIRFRPELLMDEEKPTRDIVNRPSPRTVAHVGELLKAEIADTETIAGAAGKGFAAEFCGFLEMWQSLPSLDGILLSPESAEVPEEPAALFAVTTGLASRVTADNAGRVVRYASRMPEEFGVLCIRDSLRRCPDAAKNSEFVQWASDHSDVLT